MKSKIKKEKIKKNQWLKLKQDEKNKGPMTKKERSEITI